MLDSLFLYCNEGSLSIISNEKGHLAIQNLSLLPAECSNCGELLDVSCGDEEQSLQDKSLELTLVLLNSIITARISFTAE